MLDAPSPTWLPILALVGLLAWVAVEDVRRFTIRNSVVLGVIAAFALWQITGGFAGFTLLGLHIATGLGFLVVGVLLFATGLFGAGDGKLLAALGLWAGPMLVLPMLLVAALTGAVVAAVYMLIASVRRIPTEGDAATLPLMSHRMPYGVALAAGGLWLTAQLSGIAG